MNTAHPSRILFLVTVVISLVASLFGASLPQRVMAQTAAFLISPYYGSTVVTQEYNANHHGYDFGLTYVQLLAGDQGTIGVVDWYNDNCHDYRGDDQTLGLNCGYGLHLRIDHTNGYRTIYAHLSTTAFGFDSNGTSVQQGQIIGTSGNTGWSTGPHLHFEVRNANNVTVDPFNPNLWKDGQWANPSRPIPAPSNGGETIVDDTTNNSGGFSKGSSGPFNNACQNDCGNWTSATAGYGNHIYYTPANGNTVADQWVKWKSPGPANPDQAVYEVFVYAPDAHATTWQARYTIRYYDGVSEATALVDQSGLSNQNGLSNRWVSLGIYNMTSNDYVYATDAAQETYGLHCGANQWCELGADAVKFVRRGTTYLPDIRAGGGWTSSVIMHNNSGGTAYVRASYFADNGVWKCGNSGNMSAQETTTYIPCAEATSGFVDAGGDVAVVVENQSGNIADSYNGIAASDPLNPGWGQVGTTLYAPVIMNNYYGWYSRLVLSNVGSFLANVTITYYRTDGTQYGSPATLGLSPNQKQVINTPGDTNILYSARITSDQPLAVVVRQRNSSSSIFLTYNAFSAGSTTAYAPLIMNNYYGWDTSINAQSTSGAPANITLEYRQGNGQIVSTRTASIPPYSTRTFWSPNEGVPDGFIGSARVASNQPVAVVVNQSAPHNGAQTRGMTYNGAQNGSALAVLPDVLSHYDPNNYDWVSSVNVQNLGTSATVATLNYAGQSWNSSSIPANGFFSFYVPNYAAGSNRGPATVSASGSQPVAVVVNHSALLRTTTDTAWCYNGVNR